LPEDYPFPEFKKNEPVAIGVYNPNDGTVFGPIAIGSAIMSSTEMIESGMKGRGVNVLHIYHDTLW
jgi:translation initiation factor 2D